MHLAVEFARDKKKNVTVIPNIQFTRADSRRRKNKEVETTCISRLIARGGTSNYSRARLIFFLVLSLFVCLLLLLFYAA